MARVWSALHRYVSLLMLVRPSQNGVTTRQIGVRIVAVVTNPAQEPPGRLPADHPSLRLSSQFEKATSRVAASRLSDGQCSGYDAGRRPVKSMITTMSKT